MNINITALVLAYNEEKRIVNVIKALSGFNVIVLDKSSTDDTASLAEQMGAKILRVPYYNDTTPKEVRLQIKKYLIEEQANEWIFSMTSSDIIHHGLLMEMKRAIELNQNEFDVIEIPLYRYSMGLAGKNTFFGGLDYKPLLWKRNAFPTDTTMIHESSFENMPRYRMTPSDPRIAVYHLTHPNLDLVMDRTWRYAVQYIEDAGRRGRGRERVMRYAVNECIRTVFRYFRRRLWKSKETGKAQLMMLIMYNCMIFLNAFFSKEKEAEINEIYRGIIDECVSPDRDKIP
ncbi:MAG: hypothetical protein LBC96_09685 [Lachnospiraceae bacterium]|jgi:glycosyltransferase involved in cell wall biosynthesis|nr:hypothetical protein [Lachnospiraceae bacterium]